MWRVFKNCSSVDHKNCRSPCGIQCSMCIWHKYYFHTQLPRLSLRLPHLGVNLNIPSWRKTSSYMCSHLWTAVSTSSLLQNWGPAYFASSVQTVVWMVQQCLVKRLQCVLCGIASSCCRITLHDRHSSCWRSTWEVTGFTRTGRWKWLFVNGCKWKSLISTGMRFLNLCEDGKKGRINVLGKIIKKLWYLSEMYELLSVWCWHVLSSCDWGTLLIEQPFSEHNKACHQSGETC